MDIRASVEGLSATVQILGAVSIEAERAQRTALRDAGIKARQLARRRIAADHPPLGVRDLRKHVERYNHRDRVRLWVGVRQAIPAARAGRRFRDSSGRMRTASARVPLKHALVRAAIDAAGREAMNSRYPDKLRQELARRYLGLKRRARNKGK